jgi:hypothetical protein
MGDVIRINFRPAGIDVLREQLRRALAEAFVRRGFDRPALAEHLADEFAGEIRALDSRLKFEFQSAEPLSQETIDAIGQGIREIGMQATLAISRSIMAAAVATAMSALESGGK